MLIILRLLIILMLFIILKSLFCLKYLDFRVCHFMCLSYLGCYDLEHLGLLRNYLGLT